MFCAGMVDGSKSLDEGWMPRICGKVRGTLGKEHSSLQCIPLQFLAGTCSVRPVQMKALVLPTLWYLSAAGAFAGMLALAHHLGMNGFLAIVLAWAGSVFTALLIGRLAVGLKPDLRFSTRVHEDGLGYVHQPFDVVVNITLIAGLVMVFSFFFKG